MGAFDKLSALKDYVRPEWRPSKPDAFIALAGFVLLPVVLGLLIGQFSKKDVKTWYKALKKPSWSPPSVFFTLGWLIAYGLMGGAAWKVWTHGGFETHPYEFGFFFSALVLQLSWPLLAFKGRKLDLALISDVGQLGTISSTIVAFHPIEPLSSFLLIPVLLLIIFDVFHTHSLFRYNPQVNKRALHKPLRAIYKHISSERRQ